MVIAGLLLIILAGIVIAAGVLGGSGAAALEFSGLSMSATSSTIFLMGAGSAFLLFLGIVMMRSGMRRAGERRREQRRLTELGRQLDQAKSESQDVSTPPA